MKGPDKSPSKRQKTSIIMDIPAAAYGLPRSHASEATMENSLEIRAPKKPIRDRDPRRSWPWEISMILKAATRRKVGLLPPLRRMLQTNRSLF